MKSTVTKGPARYKPRGFLALEPSAFGMLFDVEEDRSPTLAGQVAIVPVRGPLMHHASFWFDSYDEIRARVAAAIEQQPKAIVLSIDSPGGLVSGAFEASTAIAAMCAGAGVPLHAYVDGCAASAAYALASVCETITIPRTAVAGSIGVIAEHFDLSENLAQNGIKARVFASGARKGDGSPHQPLTDEAAAAFQGQIMTMAAVFWEHVAVHRGMDVAAVRAMEAAIYTGAEAVSAGLADHVGTLDDLVASLAAGTAPTARKAWTMDENEKKAREALQAIVDDEAADQKARDKAKRALAAMDETEEPEDEGGDEEASAKIAGLTAVNAALMAELTALRATQPTPAQAREAEAQAREAAACMAVDTAIAEGRISPSSRETWLASARADIGVFRATVATLPALARRVTSSAPSKGAPPPKAEGRQITGDEEQARQLLERMGHKSATAHVKA